MRCRCRRCASVLDLSRPRIASPSPTTSISYVSEEKATSARGRLVGFALAVHRWHRLRASLFWFTVFLSLFGCSRVGTPRLWDWGLVILGPFLITGRRLLPELHFLSFLLSLFLFFFLSFLFLSFFFLFSFFLSFFSCVCLLSFICLLSVFRLLACSLACCLFFLHASLIVCLLVLFKFGCAGYICDSACSSECSGMSVCFKAWDTCFCFFLPRGLKEDLYTRSFCFFAG